MFTDGFFRQHPLGMNLRNHIIKELNPRESLALVKSKSAFKRVMQANGIRTARTFEEIHDYSDMKLIATFPDEFVVKPNSGFGGHGIILLRREDNHFVNPTGDKFSSADIRGHIRKILDGEFSGYVGKDIAIIEERIYPSKKLQFKNAYGLPDIRVFCVCFEPVMAMLRYPTFKSQGRANLTAGGVGIGIDVATGRRTYIHAKVGDEEPRPEDLELPDSFVMPKWEEMKTVAVKCARLSNLRITGADVILDADDQVRVLEINGRPGLEIQNVNERSLLQLVNRYCKSSP